MTIAEAAEWFHVSAVTISNWIKEGFLKLADDDKVSYQSALLFYEQHAGKTKLHSRANKLQKDRHDEQEVTDFINQEINAKRQIVNLGDRYEAKLSESYRNKEGIYYTPMTIVEDMMKDLTFDDSNSFLDPCCGSGNFLIAALKAGANPKKVYGYDTDANAIKIARERLKQYPHGDEVHLFCADFLEKAPELKLRFDYVFTNPPWGKKLNKTTRQRYVKQYQSGSSYDTCSFFILATLPLMKQNGVVGMLLPESFFNIAIFEDTRKTLLEHQILGIKDYGKPFPTIQSNACSIHYKISYVDDKNIIICNYRNQLYRRNQNTINLLPKHIFNYWSTEEDMVRIEQVLSQPYLTLEGHATWGIGIVTGNNAKICKHSRQKGFVPIYRGQDILPGRFKAASLFINPQDFPHCQQVCSDALFKAPEKIVYRFISNNLVFHCDTHQRYILNSANMLVLHPDFPLTGKQLVMLMNDAFTNWLFQQLFHTHKVLRGDLESLPLLINKL